MKRPMRPGSRPPILRKAQERVKDVAAIVRERVEDLKDKRPGGLRRTPDLETLLERASRTSVAAAPQFPPFRDHLRREIDRDGGALFMERLEERTAQQAERMSHVLQFGRELVQDVRDVGKRQRFRMEVLQPARRGLIDGTTAWARSDAIFGRPMLRDAEKRAPRLTIGLAVMGEGGLGIGAGVAVGLCGVRHGPAMCFISGAVCVGAVAELEGGVQVQFAPGSPQDFGGFAVGGSIGGGWSVTASAGIAMTPHFGVSREERWTFDSLSVAVGGGGGLDVAVSIEICGVAPLRKTTPS